MIQSLFIICTISEFRKLYLNKPLKNCQSTKFRPCKLKRFQCTTLEIHYSIFWCDFTIWFDDIEIRAPTSRREETRKRRQALQKIFRFLDVDSLLVVAQVCREWKKVSRNRSLWKRVVLENKKCSSKVKFKRFIVKENWI